MQVTRSHKYNDRDHVGLANGTASAEEHLPRYFAKSGYSGIDPKSSKKEGSGKGNWGKRGEELEDYDINMMKPRRRSNSFSASAGHNMFKSKFEHVEQDPVFEEELHGPTAEDYADLERASTGSSSGTVDEEDAAIEKK